MTKEQTEFYNAPVGSPLQIAIKDNEPLQKQIVEMIDACKKMVLAEERERMREDYVKWVLSDNYKRKYTGETPFGEWKEKAEAQDMSNWE